jgi:predicted ribosome quality control (RQC) complex YloA/Tae2 family protein
VSLTAREIDAVVAELATLAGARVDSVRAHAERALTLELFGPRGAVRLLVSAEADVTRLHVTRARPPRGGNPPPFQHAARRDLEGARLLAVEALPGDRVVALRFAGPQGGVTLVAELTGRHGNLFLVGQDGAVRASAGRNLADRRALAPGQPYVPVERGERGPGERAERGPGERGPRVSDPPPAGAGPAAASPPGAGPGAPPASARGAGGLRFAPVAGAEFPLSAAIDAAYATLEAERELADARRRLREPLRAAAARAGRALVKLADEAARVPAAEADRRTGELLAQNLRLVRRGAREVVLTEWTAEGPREVKVALDPALSPQANVERHFHRYRRIVESAARVAARAAEVRGREAALRALLAAVDAAGPGDLERLEREARRLGAAPRPQATARRRRDEPLPPYRTFRSVSGAAILVGRGPAENDALTVRVARGNDLWLHARGIPGAHVVVRTEKGKGPDQETFLDAAHLAAHFSDARGAPQAEIAATRAKFVRKVKGAAPGAVTYSQEKVTLLRLEPGRIERLLGGEEA